MNYGPALLLVAAVATVGVLHTIVPDHWVPITLIARQRGWSKSETARAALLAGTGHVLSTLLIALVVWLAGVAFAVERWVHRTRRSGVLDLARSLNGHGALRTPTCPPERCMKSFLSVDPIFEEAA